MIHLQSNFNGDICVRFVVIMENVISFIKIKEYRGPTLRLPCDVINDVITMRNVFSGIIWDDLFISEVKLNLCLIFRYFQNGHHF